MIDVSGDGPNNQGRLVMPARDEAVAKGITINGLPIMLRRPGYLDIPDLDVYYRDCVIGGQGAFMVPVREREQFPQAIKTKILLEIAGLCAAGTLCGRPGQPRDQLPRRRDPVARPHGQLSGRIPAVALVAHDAKKAEMADFVAAHRGTLAPFALFATGTTGRA